MTRDPEKYIAELYVLIDTLQTNLRTVSSYLNEEQKKEINIPSYRWCIEWKRDIDYQI